VIPVEDGSISLLLASSAIASICLLFLIFTFLVDAREMKKSVKNISAWGKHGVKAMERNKHTGVCQELPNEAVSECKHFALQRVSGVDHFHDHQLK